MKVSKTFAALFSPKSGADGNMTGATASDESTTPLEAAAFVQAVNFLKGELGEGPTLSELVRAKAAQLNNLADLVEAAEKMQDDDADDKPADDKPGDKPKE